MSGIVAIVGRPNVGKSALFNRIAGRRIAIVHDQPGVTRDRVTAEVEWNGRPFTIIDTGGIGLVRGEKSTDVIQRAMLEQVDLAIEAAHVIILVVNVQEGVVPLDEEVSKKLRATRKPVLVAVNKVDSPRAVPGVAEFVALGFERVYGVTAIHGEGTEALVDAAIALLPPWTAPVPVVVPEGEEVVAPKPSRFNRKDAGTLDRPLRLAIVGRPNVGKSSIINAVTGSRRVIVSPIPGTTRDAVDVPFEVETDGVRQSYVLVDTAGVRKARRIDDSVEFFSVERTKESIIRSDIAVLVLDAETGITEQDKKIADVIVEAKRACIVVINKWDLVAQVVRKAREDEIQEREAKTRDRDDRRKRLTTLAEFGEWVQSRLFFLDYAPVIFTSAKDGFQLDRLLEAVRYVAAQLRQTVPTAILNRTLQTSIEARQPVSAQGHRLRFYYATQVKQAPPTFKLFVNRDELFSPPYEKYLKQAIRAAFGYEGCPVVLLPCPRPRTIDPVRKFKRQPFSEDRAVRHGRQRGTKPGPLFRGVPRDPRRNTKAPTRMDGPAPDAPPERPAFRPAYKGPAKPSFSPAQKGPAKPPFGRSHKGPAKPSFNPAQKGPAQPSFNPAQKGPARPLFKGKPQVSRSGAFKGRPKSGSRPGRKSR